MTDPHTPAQRSSNMAAVRRRDTAPERALRRELHARRLRYRVDLPIRVDGGRAPRPDIVFTRARVAVFVHGCFWHGCAEGHKGTAKSNADYWGRKIASNRERDADQVERLRSAGWRVLVFWEHDTPVDAADATERAVRGRHRATLTLRRPARLGPARSEAGKRLRPT